MPVQSPEVVRFFIGLCANTLDQVETAYRAQCNALQQASSLLDYRKEVTLARIDRDCRSNCDCGELIDTSALKERLEIFCPACLATQSQQTKMLQGLLAKAEDEYAALKETTIKEMQAASQSVKLCSNHMADQPSTFNTNLCILLPSFERKIKGLKEVLQRVQFGKYGICIECDGIIPLRRLQIEPHAKMCVACLSVKPPPRVRELIFTR